MKINRIISIILSVLIMMSITGCGGKNIYNSNNNGELLAPVDYGKSEEPFEDYKVFEENEFLKLSLNGKTTEIAIEDKRSGEMWYSNPQNRHQDETATPENIRKMSSQISINYHLNAAPKSMDNFTESIERAQYKIYKIKGGVKVVYTIGKAEKTIILPTVISEERFLFFTDKIEDTEVRESFKRKYKLRSLESAKSDEQREKMLRDYPKVSEYNVYAQNPGIKEYLLLEMAEQFAPTGYTLEDMIKDNEEHGIVVEIKEPETFTIPVEYRLDKAEFKATIPLKEIRYNTKVFQLMRISLLEFFGSGGLEDNGFIFMPDGSGAIVNFNNGKSTSGNYVLQVYGIDRSKKYSTLNPKGSQTFFPVFGIKNGNGAYLAVIEEGDMFANINASISGRLNSQNNAYVDFDYLQSETLDLALAAGTNIINMYQPRPYNGNYSVTYKFLNGEEADYNGMAREYQRHLEEKGLIKKQEARDQYPFYMELVGAIDKKHVIMGVSVDGQEVLTSYDEAYKIVKESKEKGIKEIVLKYTGMFNGGVRNTPLSKIEPIGKLGGNSDLRSLTQKLTDEKTSVYADLDFQYIHQTALFDGFDSKKDSLRYINKDIANIYPYDVVSREELKNRSSKAMLTPNRYLWYSEKMSDGLNKLNITGFSAPTFGTDLSSAYEKDMFYDRSEVIDKTVESFEKIRESGLDIMTNGANLYLLAGSKDVINLTTNSSFNMTADLSIPFFQMVLRGYVEFASEPINLSDDPIRTFLKTVETGGGLYYKWIYRDNALVRRTQYDDLFSTNYNYWIKDSTEKYIRLEKDFSPLQGQKIVEHKIIENDVVKVTYESGTEIIVNYSLNSYLFNGVTVKSNDYAIIK